LKDKNQELFKHQDRIRGRCLLLLIIIQVTSNKFD